jgi:hypothetical protein
MEALGMREGLVKGEWKPTGMGERESMEGLGGKKRGGVVKRVGLKQPELGRGEEPEGEQVSRRRGEWRRLSGDSVKGR